MKQFVVSIVVLLSFLSVYSDDFTEQKGGHVYTIEVPDYMVKTYQLNETASLQYQCVSKYAYMVVIDDAKQKLQDVGFKFVGAKVFLNVYLESYNTEAKNRKVGSVEEFKSNGYDHAQTEMTWTEGKTDYYLLITCVETKDYFYKILCWTTQKNKDKLKKDFLRISKSLKD